MYIILNTHHDEYIFDFADAKMTESIKAFKKIWGQIADTFKDYDEKLIFEALNEPGNLTPGSNKWGGGTPEQRANLNTYYQAFVDTVRASGGHNDKRILMINTYAASGTVAVAVNDLVLPTDTVPNKLIVSVHSYVPDGFAFPRAEPTPQYPNRTGTAAWSKNNTSDTNPITTVIDRVYDKFVSAEIPVVMGEFGAVNKKNDAARAEWAEFYVSYAKSKGIPCLWWDNQVFNEDGGENFGLLSRVINLFEFPAVLRGLMKGAGVI
jgi:endoglucanase